MSGFPASKVLPNAADLARAAHGLKGETFSRMQITSSAAWSTGDQRAMLMGLPAGVPVTNVFTQISVVGSGLTLCKLGLWALDGTLLAATADVSAQFTAIGIKGGALTTPYLPTVDGSVFIGGIVVGTTPPTMGKLNTYPTGVTGAGLGAGAPLATSKASMADVGAFSPVVVSSANYWFGWS